MIGVFDSGVGGFNSVPHLRHQLPAADILYHADRKNAPYGTKGAHRLVDLVSLGIDRLAERGAEQILLACCTASTLWEGLSPQRKRISYPIITPSASAIDTSAERILVIATERTVASGAFSGAIKERLPEASVLEAPMQGLVSAVERGSATGRMAECTRSELEKLTEIAKAFLPDTMVLGCTHFSAVEELIRCLLPEVEIINPARIGALSMVKRLSELGINTKERGRLIYF